MNKSESLVKIAPALVKAQEAIKAAIKDATNPHFRSKYADLGAVVEAVKPALVANGLTFLQGVEDAEGGVKIETMLLHTSGEWISSTMRIPASKQDAQGYGSAITYGRRYGLQSMCGVPAEDDDGNAAAKGSANERTQNANTAKGLPAAPITPTSGAGETLSAEQRKRVESMASEVIDCFEAGAPEAAYGLIEDAKLDTDEKLFLWTFLDSKMRAALKKISAERKQAALKREEATQP